MHVCVCVCVGLNEKEKRAERTIRNDCLSTDENEMLNVQLRKPEQR